MPNPKWPRGDVRWLVHTPAELATQFVEMAEKRADPKTPGVTFGIPSIDKKVIPMRGGDYVGIIARPGHGKSSLLAALALREARAIQKQQANEIVVVVTWEQMAEEFEMLFAGAADEGFSSSDVAWGRADMDRIRAISVKRPRLPIWTIGYGAFRAGKAPRMTLEKVLDAIRSIEGEFGKRPTLAVFDYLQLIPMGHGGGSDRVAQVTHASNEIKNLATSLDMACVAGMQARREVEDRMDKTPTSRDAQWSSNAEQDTDKLFALMRPWRYIGTATNPSAHFTEIKGKRVKTTPELFFFKMLKQRFEEGQHTWLLSFKPEFLRLAEMELEAPMEDENAQPLPF